MRNEKLKQILQRECLGRWLREVVAQEHKNDTLPTSGSALIFYYLCSGDLISAVKEAITSKRHLLAITLATFQNSRRAAYRKQVITQIFFQRFV